MPAPVLWPLRRQSPKGAPWVPAQTLDSGVPIVVVAASLRNWAPNPSIENPSGYYGYLSTVAQDSTHALYGANALKVSGLSTGGTPYQDFFHIPPDVPAWWGAWIYSTVATTYRVQISNSIDQSIISAPQSVPANTWTLVEGTGTPNSTNPDHWVLYAYTDDAAPADYWVDGYMVVSGVTAFPGVFFETALAWGAEVNTAVGGTVINSYTAPPVAEQDSAVGGTILQTQSVLGGVAPEQDSAVVGKVAQVYTAPLATEQESATVGKVLQRYTTTPAPETDSAPAGSVRQTYTASPAVENDAAAGGKAAQVYASAPAVEQDAAVAGKVLQRYTASPAAESDSASAGQVQQRYAAGAATEADSVLSGKVTQRYTAPPAVENDSAPAGTVNVGNLQNIPGGVARENDASIGGRVLQVYAAGVAGEADSAPGAHVAQLYLAGAASELDSAVAGFVREVYTAGPASEADSAVGGTVSNPATILGGVAREADFALGGQLLGIIAVLVVDDQPLWVLETAENRSGESAEAAGSLDLGEQRTTNLTLSETIT